MSMITVINPTSIKQELFSSIQLLFKQELFSSIQLLFKQELFSSIQLLFKQELQWSNNLER